MAKKASNTPRATAKPRAKKKVAKAKSKKGSSRKKISAENLFDFLSLRNVRLLSIDAKVQLVSDELPPKPTVSLEAGAGISPDNQLHVNSSLGVAAGSPDADSSYFGINAIYQCVYSVEGIDPQQIAEASEVNEALVSNGVFVAWPYFRDLVQSTTTRMGLPPVVIPVFSTGRPVKNAVTLKHREK